mgnify:CR=1 FL=1
MSYYWNTKSGISTYYKKNYYMLAENMINQVYYCTLHDQVMYTVKIAKLSLFLLKYLYGYSLSPIDSFPRATLLEC